LFGSPAGLQSGPSGPGLEKVSGGLVVVVPQNPEFRGKRHAYLGLGDGFVANFPLNACRIK